jgi:hypothetical protein
MLIIVKLQHIPSLKSNEPIHYDTSKNGWSSADCIPKKIFVHSLLAPSLSPINFDQFLEQWGRLQIFASGT